MWSSHLSQPVIDLINKQKADKMKIISINHNYIPIDKVSVSIYIVSKNNYNWLELSHSNIKTKIESYDDSYSACKILVCFINDKICEFIVSDRQYLNLGDIVRKWIDKNRKT